MPHELGVLAETFDEGDVPYAYLDAWTDAVWPSLDDVSGVVVLGGEMNADEVERHPFLGRERELLRDAVGEGVPILGICLGAQLLARALGAAVPRSPVRELGFLPITLTEAGRDDAVTAPFDGAPRVFQWHADTFELPDAAVLLASSDVVPHQAFRVDEHAYALQFHPEPTQDGIAAWCERWADDIRQHWGTTAEEVIAGVREHLPAQRRAAREAFAAFGDLVRKRG